jgi:glycosyltransferase involved in cell wall biosynthesis
MTMLTSQRVSVVMAVHNNAPYLQAAVRSILEQTHSHLEFIIVNDGSTDATASILAQHARNDDRIRVLDQTNAGLTASLIRGVREAKGDLIARMDGDDISLPHRLEHQLSFLAEHKDVVAVGTQVLDIDTYGGFIGQSLRECEDEDIQRQLLAGHGAAMCHPAVMFRRAAYDGVGGYDAAYDTAQDLDLFLRLGEVGRLANLDSLELLYRIHTASTNARKHSRQIRNRDAIVRSAFRRRGIEFHEGQILPWPCTSFAEQCHRLMWANLKFDQRAAAHRHALTAVARSPLNFDCWKKLLYIWKYIVTSG